MEKIGICESFLINYRKTERDGREGSLLLTVEYLVCYGYGEYWSQKIIVLQPLYYQWILIQGRILMDATNMRDLKVFLHRLLNGYEGCKQ